MNNLLLVIGGEFSQIFFSKQIFTANIVTMFLSQLGVIHIIVSI